MSDANHEYCLARAEAERLAGDAATLANVRDRCRRSEAAWRAMAERGERTRQMREAREQEKVEADALAGGEAVTPGQ